MAEFAAHADGLTFVKTHGMAARNHAGQWLTPPGAVQAVLFLVRHPFDVAVSFANHFAVSIDRAIEIMCEAGFRLGSQSCNISGFLPELCGSWSEHTISWMGSRAPLSCLRARYEDLLRAPAEIFAMLAAGVGVPCTPASLGRAIENTRFERLKEEEQRSGFIERPTRAKAFFREGRSGGWRSVLSGAQQLKLARHCGGAMELAGYGEDGHVGAPPAEFQRALSSVA